MFGHAGARVIVFPTRTGRFFDYENWGLIAALKDHIDNGWLQLYCLDSVDGYGLYSCDIDPREKMGRHLQFESYVLEEVLPLTAKVNPNPFLISHGCSIGAFHAVNIAFKYPHLFGKVVAFSGRYDLTRQVGDFPDLFCGYYDQTIYYNTPNHFVPNIQDPIILGHLRKMEIVLAIGERDSFLDSNVKLSQALWKIGVWHALHIWPGKAHKPVAWKQMSARYM